MKRLIWILEAVFFLAFSLPLAILPYGTALRAGETLGILVFHLWSGRRKIAVENIRKSLHLLESRGAAEDIARKAFMNFGKSFAEIVKIYYGFGKDIIDNVEIKGAENYFNASSKGRGVIVVTGHCGNWELMALAFGEKIAPASGVARAQNNPYLNRFIEKVRARHGNSVIYKKGALKGIFSALKKNGVVGILMDQSVLKEEGYIVDFLGRGAWTTKMPALIARKTGAAVIPVFINRSGRKNIVAIHPEIELSRNNDSEKAVIEDTKKFTRFIEDYVKHHPDEWLWIHRRWKRVE